MKMKIDKIIKQPILEFSTSIGSGIGCWHNNNLPNEGEWVSVELDINEILKIGFNANLSTDKVCFIRHSEDENEIQGIVDGIDEDGLIYLRLTPDCLIMVESSEDQIKEGDYILLRINAKNFVIT